MTADRGGAQASTEGVAIACYRQGVTTTDRLLFLPGASGNTQFWRPAAARLAAFGTPVFQAYPGFGGEPPAADVRDIGGLLSRVLAQLTTPTDVIAQSMGGVLAVRAALTRPGAVRSLVLTATSGGLDTSALGAHDWRADFQRNFPGAPDWFATERSDLSGRLSEVQVPTLLLWGDSDPLSPVAVGERLAALLPRAELVVIAGGDHDLAHTHAEVVAEHISRHLRQRV